MIKLPCSFRQNQKIFNPLQLTTDVAKLFPPPLLSSYLFWFCQFARNRQKGNPFKTPSLFSLLFHQKMKKKKSLIITYWFRNLKTNFNFSLSLSLSLSLIIHVHVIPFAACLDSNPAELDCIFFPELSWPVFLNDIIIPKLWNILHTCTLKVHVAGVWCQGIQILN